MGDKYLLSVDLTFETHWCENKNKFLSDKFDLNLSVVMRFEMCKTFYQSVETCIQK